MSATVAPAGPTPIEADLETEARRLLAMVDERGLQMRLIGGMAIRLLAGDRLHPAFERRIQDLDFVVDRRGSRHAQRLLEEAGYTPEAQFNALNGATRLLYLDSVHRRQIDVFVETFEMCHQLPLADRLGVRPDTLPAGDLVMTKLQIVELNAKDRGDIYALLDSHSEGELELDRIASLAGNDWGLHHTFELNLARLRDGVSEAAIEPERATALVALLDTIDDAIQSVPKTRKWKLRARVGERKRWYDEPEEVDRDQ